MSNFIYEIFNDSDVQAQCGDDADYSKSDHTLLMVQPKATMTPEKFEKTPARNISSIYSDFGRNHHTPQRWWGWGQYWNKGRCHMTGRAGRNWGGYLYFPVGNTGFQVQVEDQLEGLEYGDGGQLSREDTVKRFGEHSVLRAEQEERALWQWNNCGRKKGGIPCTKLVPPGFMEILRVTWNIGLQEISRQQAVELVGAEVTANCEQLCHDLYVAAPRHWLYDTSFFYHRELSHTRSAARTGE